MEMFSQFINQESKPVIRSLRIDDLRVLRNTMKSQQSSFLSVFGGANLLVHGQVEQFRQVVRNHDLWVCFMARHLLFLQFSFLCFKSSVLLSRLRREATKWFLCASDGRASCGATATDQLRHYSRTLIGWKGYRIQAFRSVGNVTRGELPHAIC